MLAAYVVTKDRKGLARGRSALSISELVLRTASGNTWGLDRDVFDEAHSVEAQNLYSSSMRGQGIALWAVGWLQPVSLQSEGLETDLADFTHYHSDWDLHPGAEPNTAPLPIEDVDATNDVDLPGSGGAA